MPAATPEALETPHLLPPPAFPILAPPKTPPGTSPHLARRCPSSTARQATRMTVVASASASHSWGLHLRRCSSRVGPGATPVAKHLPQWGRHTVNFVFLYPEDLVKCPTAQEKGKPTHQTMGPKVAALKCISGLLLHHKMCISFHLQSEKSPSHMDLLRFTTSLTTHFSASELLGLGGDATCEYVAVTRQL